MEAEETSEALYLKCCAGDEDAWVKLGEYVQLSLRGQFVQLNEFELSDITSQVYTKLIAKGLRQIKKPCYFRTYVYRVANNTALDYLKARNRECLYGDTESFRT